MENGKTEARVKIMQTFNFSEVKANFAGLLEQVGRGQSFIIAKAGRPLAKIVPCDVPRQASRLGFMEGQATVAADIKEVGKKEIAAMFGLNR
ncbi:antitoxin [Planctomycetales bacterium]|nr:antitoxin [Planctomycetales bacterium]